MVFVLIAKFDQKISSLCNFWNFVARFFWYGRVISYLSPCFVLFCSHLLKLIQEQSGLHLFKQLAVVSRDLTQSEKRVTDVKPKFTKWLFPLKMIKKLPFWVNILVIFINCSALSIVIFFSPQLRITWFNSQLLVISFSTKIHIFENIISFKCFSFRSKELKTLLWIVGKKYPNVSFTIWKKAKSQKWTYFRKISVEFISKIFRLK